MANCINRRQHAPAHWPLFDEASRLISPRHFSPSHVGATALKNPLTLSPSVPPLAFEKETLKKSVSSQQQRAFLWGPFDLLRSPFAFLPPAPLFRIVFGHGDEVAAINQSPHNNNKVPSPLPQGKKGGIKKDRLGALKLSLLCNSSPPFLH